MDLYSVILAEFFNIFPSFQYEASYNLRICFTLKHSAEYWVPLEWFPQVMVGLFNQSLWITRDEFFCLTTLKFWIRNVWWLQFLVHMRPWLPSMKKSHVCHSPFAPCVGWKKSCQNNCIFRVSLFWQGKHPVKITGFILKCFDSQFSSLCLSNSVGIATSSTSCRVTRTNLCS